MWPWSRGEELELGPLKDVRMLFLIGVPDECLYCRTRPVSIRHVLLYEAVAGPPNP
jgi:hypothetical protein